MKPKKPTNKNIFRNVRIICIICLPILILVLISQINTITTESNTITTELNCSIYEQGRYWYCNDGQMYDLYDFDSHDYFGSNYSQEMIYPNKDYEIDCIDIGSTKPIESQKLPSYIEARYFYDYYKENHVSHFNFKMECVRGESK